MAFFVSLFASVAPRVPARARALSMTASASRRLTLSNADETIKFGARLALVCKAGDVVLLRGDYGAGKTCLARGFIRQWCDDPDELVTSPSYLIDNVYDDPDMRALQPGVAVHHMDLWRLPEGKVSQLVDLPKVFAECVSLIEWPDKLGSLRPAQYLDVQLSIVEPTEAEAEERAAAAAKEQLPEYDYDEEFPQPRIATLSAHGDDWAARLRDVAASDSQVVR